MTTKGSWGMGRTGGEGGRLHWASALGQSRCHRSPQRRSSNQSASRARKLRRNAISVDGEHWGGDDRAEGSAEAACAPDL